MQRSTDAAACTAVRSTSYGAELLRAPTLSPARARVNPAGARARQRCAPALLALALLLCALAGGGLLEDDAARLKKGGSAANSVNAELAELMEEPPGGHNAGRASSTNPGLEGRHLPLSPTVQQAREFVVAGGWDVVDPAKDGRRSGGSSHRGVLRGDEHVDQEALREMAEAQLGFTYDQVRSVFRQGRLSSEQGELRALIDAQLLALSLAGANMSLLGRLLGFPIKPNGNCAVVDNALARARAEA